MKIILNLNINRVINLVFILFLVSCQVRERAKKEVSIIPQVQKTIIKESYFRLKSNSVFGTENDEQFKIAKYLSDKINKAMNWSTSVIINPSSEVDIEFVSNYEIVEEGYQIKVDKTKIRILASSNSGFFYGMQSLRQLLPNDIERSKNANINEVIISQLQINDAPAFSWRGMMLDVSRHFYSIEEVKDFIDLMSFLKLNKFHWHLVDDQGWRIEIKKYPRLTEVGAWRVNKEDKHWNERELPLPTERAGFGGFYTQEQIREVVSYAKSKYITVIPEIEVPAHVMSAIAAYPFLSCSEKQIMVPSGGVWPITEIYCAGKESTYEFIEDVLDEVIELFPSKYIHIGGDEATKINWKSCEHCQLKMKTENLNGIDQLQSYMIKHFSSYLKAKGRIMIGWDEILEGGLAKDAIVMSWRGEKGGVEAAEHRQNVVMSPNTYVYFDYYQASKENEPLAIGGYLPLSKVYEFNPIPEDLEKEYHEYVLGGQANIWTEYMPTYKHLQYMVFPRILALSESVWTKNEQKDWNNFSERVLCMMDRLKAMDINYSKSAFKIRSDKKYNSETKELELKLFNEFEGTEIRYTLDKSSPNKKAKLYSHPINVEGDLTVKAQAYNGDTPIGEVYTDSVKLIKNKAFGKKVIYKNKYTQKYNSGGEFGLVDQLCGSTAFDDRKWQGWFDTDVEFTIDLGVETSINEINMNLLVDRKNQILLPRRIKIYNSNNNEEFSLLVEFNNKETLNNKLNLELLRKDFIPFNSRFIKVKIDNSSNKRTAEKGWTFIDEFIVR